MIDEMNTHIMRNYNQSGIVQVQPGGDLSIGNHVNMAYPRSMLL